MTDIYVEVGTVAVTNGSGIVTGTSTSWSATVEPGDLLVVGDRIGFVASVNSSTEIALLRPWSGATETAASYFIAPISASHDNVKTNRLLREYTEKLLGGAFFQPDTVGSLAERSQFNTEARGFSFADVTVSPHVIYIKASDVAGDWSAGAPWFPPGPAGQDGSAVAQGDAGASATIQIGAVQTGAAGSAVQVSNTGTVTDAIFNFLIPRGADGASSEGVRSTVYVDSEAPTDGVTDASSELQAANNLATTNVDALIIDDAYLIENDVTLSANVSFVEGGFIIVDGCVLDIVNSLAVDRRQIFVCINGGSVVGSPKLQRNRTSPIWWGGDPSEPNQVDTESWQKAVDFAEQRTIFAGGQGGALIEVDDGYWKIDATINVNASGVIFIGSADEGTITNVEFVGTIDGILFQGNTNGTGASYGVGAQGIKFRRNTPNQASGRDLYFRHCHDPKVEDCEFYDFYRAIECFGCEGSNFTKVNSNGFGVSNHDPLATQPDSAWIALLGDPAATTTGLTERTGLYGNNGTTPSIDFCVFTDGIDVVQSHANHFAGARTAKVRIGPTASGKNSYNWTSDGDIFEGLTGYGSYAVLIDNSVAGVSVDNLKFNNCQFYNGGTNCIKITGNNGASARAVTVSDSTFKQCNNTAIHAEVGLGLTFADLTFIDGDIDSTGTAGHIEVGNGSIGPTGVTISGCRSFQDPNNAASFPASVAFGVKVRTGSSRVKISDCDWMDCTDGIINEIKAGLIAENNTVDADTVVAYTEATSNTIAPPIGIDSFSISDNANAIFYIDQGVATKDRRLTFRSSVGGVVLFHYAGNAQFTGALWLKGGVNYTLAAYEAMTVQYDEDVGMWFEA